MFSNIALASSLECNVSNQLRFWEKYGYPSLLPICDLKLSYREQIRYDGFREMWMCNWIKYNTTCIECDDGFKKLQWQLQISHFAYLNDKDVVFMQITLLINDPIN